MFGFEDFRLWFGNGVTKVLFDAWGWWFIAGRDRNLIFLFSCAIAWL